MVTQNTVCTCEEKQELFEETNQIYNDVDLSLSALNKF